jgi:hypothetical protein
VLNRGAAKPLFRRGGNPGTEARLGLLGYDDRLIADGFHSAALILARALRDGGPHPHLLVYPLVFSFRHYVELTLKHLVRLLRSFVSFGNEAKLDDALGRHGLDALLKFLIEGILSEDPSLKESEELALLTTRIEELQDQDPGSFAFRYTQDKQGRRYIQANTAFDLDAFSEEMEQVASLLADVEAWTVDVKVCRVNEWAAAVDKVLVGIRHDASSEIRMEEPLRLISGNVLQMQWTRSGTSRWVTCQLFEDKLIHMWFWDESRQGIAYEELVSPNPDDKEAIEASARSIWTFFSAP